jgi:hypothetical protein
MTFLAQIGLTSADGRLSFSKSMAIAVLVVSAKTGAFDSMLGSALLAASFGIRGWLGSKTPTKTTNELG